MTDPLETELPELTRIALLVAEEAATLVTAGFRERPAVEHKGLKDLVTRFDRASEDLLMSRLASLTPSIPVVGEEQVGSGATRARKGAVWYVDPIDGTTNFVHGHPFWCVSVGLMLDDRPVAGAVVAPILDVRWTGWTLPQTMTGAATGRGGEALRNGAPCRVSRTERLVDALVATGFPPVRDRSPDNNFEAFMAVKRAAQAVRRCGSAAIDLCMVGDGTYDAYWERRLHAWDCAAAGALVLAAGGRITALGGGVPDFHTGHIAASNGLCHAELLQVLGGLTSGEALL